MTAAFLVRIRTVQPGWAMIATMFGALKDATAAGGLDLVGPIADFPTFEQLEFKGQNQEHLVPFL